MTSVHDITAKIICDAIGRRAIAEAIGVTPAAVSNYSAAGVFPASWYLAVKAMCDARGLVCPEGLFNFVNPSIDQEQGVATQ